MSEPERWLTSPDAPGPMREMLSAAQKVGPSTLERAALAGKLGVATSGLWIAPALKGLAGAAVIAGGVWIAATAGSSSDNAAAPVPTIASQSLSAPPSNLDPPKAIEPAPAAASASPAAQAESAPALKTPTVRAAPGPVAPEAKKPSETSLISGARKSLEASPRVALDLLAQHAKLYPSGILAEEREVLRIRALKNLGRAKDAQLQEEKFHKEHPGSVHHVP